MLIHELSKVTGVSPHTIRYYHKAGLIKGKRDQGVQSNNYLHYNEETVEKLEFIRDAKSVGFTISEIGSIIDSWHNRKFSKAEKLSILSAKLDSLERKIQEILEMKERITEFKTYVEEGQCV
jgi:DNA-binding transcriptional MerR regulator